MKHNLVKIFRNSQWSATFSAIGKFLTFGVQTKQQSLEKKTIEQTNVHKYRANALLIFKLILNFICY